MHGYQHTAVQFALLTPLLGAALLLHQLPLTLPFALAYTAGTLFVTPDLDLRFNDARRRWGPLRFIWGPYVRFSKHRGMSHTYLAGPTIRLLYLALWLLPPALLALHLLPLLGLGGTPGASSLPARAVVPGLLRASALPLLGYFVSQWLHLLEDRIYPWSPPQGSD